MIVRTPTRRRRSLSGPVTVADVNAAAFAQGQRIDPLTMQQVPYDPGAIVGLPIDPTTGQNTPEAFNADVMPLTPYGLTNPLKSLSDILGTGGTPGQCTNDAGNPCGALDIITATSTKNTLCQGCPFLSTTDKIILAAVGTIVLIALIK